MYPASAGVLKVKSAGLMQDGNIWTGRQSQAGFTHEQHPYDGILISGQEGSHGPGSLMSSILMMGY